MAPKQRGATRGGSYDSRLKGLAGADFYSGPVTSGLIPENYWGDTEASSTWTNPYFIENSPLKTNDRYDYTVPGSGLSNSENNSLGFSGLPMAIDRAFAAGQWLSPIDVGPPEESAAKKLAAGDYSQLGLALGYLTPSERQSSTGLADLINKSKSELDPDYVGAVKHNQQYENYKNAFKTYTTNPDYLWAWDQLGIDPKTLTSPEALAKISPDEKAAVFDLVGRRLQQKNQRENWGLKNSFGLALTLGSMFVGNPYAAAALAGSGSAVQGGDIGDIALAAGIAGIGNVAADKFGTWAKTKFPNATAATGIKSLGTPAGWGGVGLEVAEQLIRPTVHALGQELFAESPPATPEDSPSDSQGGTDRIAQGMGSLPQTAPSFVDPTPYLGVADLSPAFMNPLELENVASPSGTTSLNPAFMNQLELANVASPSGVTSLNPAFMNPLELENVASPSGVTSLAGTTSLNPAFMNQLERAELGSA